VIDLGTTYLGLNLKNPLVASPSPLSADLDNIRKMEDAGAAAVVMHSLFEEQLAPEKSRGVNLAELLSPSPDLTPIYLPDVTSYNQGPEGYLEHLYRAKRAVQIPIIASLNGISRGGWTSYAVKMQEAGADAIELNTYFLPAEPDVSSAKVEQAYCDLVQWVKSTIRIPLAVKLSPYFSAIANMARRLKRAGADALVLFNRFYEPDFDLERLEVVPSLALSDSRELGLRLHWVAMLYDHVDADLAVTGGVHTAEDALKAIAAGADIVMMTSALLKNGIDHFTRVLADLKQWMEEREYHSIRRIRGTMAMRSVWDTSAFERANYLRVLSSFASRTSNKDGAE
jgi:dihydroorotate dehydrogenase (fumarate)